MVYVQYPIHLCSKRKYYLQHWPRINICLPSCHAAQKGVANFVSSEFLTYFFAIYFMAVIFYLL
jgi:hypothetical protein